MEREEARMMYIVTRESLGVEARVVAEPTQPDFDHQMPSLKPVTVAAGFPVYSLAFTRIGISKDSAAERLILGGGGGSSKSGVRNKLCMYAVRDSTLELLCDFPLAEDEDAPMCLATHPQVKYSCIRLVLV